MKIIDRCIDYLVFITASSESDYVLYKYAFNILKSIILWGVILTVIGMISGQCSVVLVIFLAIIPLRKLGGGYHLKSEFACIFASTIIMIILLNIVLSKCICTEFLVGAAVISGTVELINGVVDSNARQLERYEKRRFALVTRIVLVMELVIAGILLLSGVEIYCRCILSAVIACAILQLLAVIERVFSSRQWR